ncbi:hypothetical protein C1H46_031655 [Malus baccata]|uniref:Uncharacterized protein n=1 Tax=Malus baccata TaxID=106549 RepID=A0A540L8F8_MALBA|nr:hypothetical protein C1H46_031655 [Malus baccata]
MFQESASEQAMSLPRESGDDNCCPFYLEQVEMIQQQQQQQQNLFPLSGVGYMNPRTPLRSVLCHVLR